MEGQRYVRDRKASAELHLDVRRATARILNVEQNLKDLRSAYASYMAEINDDARKALMARVLEDPDIRNSSA